MKEKGEVTKREMGTKRLCLAYATSEGTHLLYYA